jgi:hypothetical protein
MDTKEGRDGARACVHLFPSIFLACVYLCPSIFQRIQLRIGFVARKVVLTESGFKREV